jgi:hypothetical protein
MRLIEKLRETKEEMSGLFHPLLERVCSSLPLNITLYEKEGRCTLESESCKHSLYTPQTGYLCKKKTYTLLRKPTPQFL